MSFEEKSTVAMLIAFVLVYGWYFLGMYSFTQAMPVADIDYEGRMLTMVGVLIGLIIVGHIVIAAVNPADADETSDERDRLIGWRADARSSWVLVIGVLAAMGLVMMGAEGFWIAHLLLAALVLTEIASGVMKLIDYRRGL